MTRRRTNRRRSRRRGGFINTATAKLRRGENRLFSTASNIGSTAADDTKNVFHKITGSAQDAVGLVGNTVGNLFGDARRALKRGVNTLKTGGKYRKTKRKHRKHRKSKKSHKKH